MMSTAFSDEQFDRFGGEVEVDTLFHFLFPRLACGGRLFQETSASFRDWTRVCMDSNVISSEKWTSSLTRKMELVCDAFETAAALLTLTLTLPLPLRVVHISYPCSWSRMFLDTEP